jgi:hypothetical protein
LHVSSQTPFIPIIRFIFASKYSHKLGYKYLIWCKINTCWSKYPLQSEHSIHIFSYWQIFASKYSFWREYFKNLEGAQAWDIRDRVIYTERSHLCKWFEDWTKKSKCVKC